jgi:hypothetical protein
MNNNYRSYITNFQYHEISIEFVQKLYNNMSVQNMWASKCKNDTKIHITSIKNYLYFLLMMFRCKICTIYILIKLVQLL